MQISEVRGIAFSEDNINGMTFWRDIMHLSVAP